MKIYDIRPPKEHSKITNRGQVVDLRIPAFDLSKPNKTEIAVAMITRYILNVANHA